MRTELIADIAAATPAEIDARGTELTHAVKVLNGQIANMDRREKSGFSIDMIEWDSLKARRNELTREFIELSREFIELSREFTRRGTWNRYYLALSHNGHVHSSMRCSTCNKGGHVTQFIRLDAEAGATPEAVVAKAKTQACTTCFPWAPVTTERGEYRTPDQEEKERKAAERAARKAAADAKKITTPDGRPLREAAISFKTGEMVDSYEIKTAVAAQRALVGVLADMADISSGWRRSWRSAAS